MAPSAALVVFALAIEAALTWLLTVAVRQHRHTLALRRAALVTLTATLLCSAAAAVATAAEILNSDYPWTIPGAPLGTYAQPTTLGVGITAATFGLLAVISVIAFARPMLGGRLIAAGAALVFLDSLRVAILDDTSPREDVAFVLIVVALPLAIVAALLRSAVRLPVDGTGGFDHWGVRRRRPDPSRGRPAH